MPAIRRKKQQPEPVPIAESDPTPAPAEDPPPQEPGWKKGLKWAAGILGGVAAVAGGIYAYKKGYRINAGAALDKTLTTVEVTSAVASGNPLAAGRALRNASRHDSGPVIRKEENPGVQGLKEISRLGKEKYLAGDLEKNQVRATRMETHQAEYIDRRVQKLIDVAYEKMTARPIMPSPHLFIVKNKIKYVANDLEPYVGKSDAKEWENDMIKLQSSKQIDFRDTVNNRLLTKLKDRQMDTSEPPADMRPVNSVFQTVPMDIDQHMSHISRTGSHERLERVTEIPTVTSTRGLNAIQRANVSAYINDAADIDPQYKDDPMDVDQPTPKPVRPLKFKKKSQK